MAYNILLIDDNEETLATTRELMSRWGYQIDAVTSGSGALTLLKRREKEYAVAVVDFRMPEQNGDAVARAIQEIDSEVVILIYSGDPSREALKAVVSVGIAGFIEKSEDTETLKAALRSACEKFLETRQTAKLRRNDAPNEKLIEGIGMIGSSDGMANVARLCEKAYSSSLPVLLIGETGVGKEMVAKAIARERPIFSVNCAAFTNSQLVEAELFGYEKGAFTGANQRKVGIFEAAKGGVVFLDELDQLPLEAQPKLLRAIREKQIRRLGSNTETPISVSLITAVKPGIRERIVASQVTDDSTVPLTRRHSDWLRFISA